MGLFWNVLLEHGSYEGAGRQGQTQSNSGWWKGPTEILSSDIGFEIASFPRFRMPDKEGVEIHLQKSRKIVRRTHFRTGIRNCMSRSKKVLFDSICSCH